MSISITIILVQNFFWNDITWKHFVVAQFTALSKKEFITSSDQGEAQEQG